MPFYRTLRLILFFVLFSVTCSLAQDSISRVIPPAHWQQLTADKAFTYKNEIENFKAPKRPVTYPFLQKLARLLGSIFSSSLWVFVLWAILIGVVVFVIYTVATSNGNFLFGKKNLKPAGGNQVELMENLEDADWENLIQKALQDNNLRMAVRYTYMLLLKLMQEKQLIKYRDDKTNFEYYKELEATVYKKPFKQLTREYEFAFYGNYTPTEADYNNFSSLFNTVKKQLGY